MDKTQVVKALGANIRQLMKKKGLSVAQLARLSDKQQSTISRIVKGQMAVSAPVLLDIAAGLGVSINQIFKGLDVPKNSVEDNPEVDEETVSAGVLSINHMRLCCVIDEKGQVIGTSELKGDLDLAETLPSVITRLKESVAAALSKEPSDVKFLNINLAVVVQSYEFDDKKAKFISMINQEFNCVEVLPDWHITYLAAFGDKVGLSLVADKGVSLSYLHDGRLKKLNGWKYPVDDRGGENWLGVETIHHTIDAFEGHVPMTDLAKKVLAEYNNRIERILETCYSSNDPDIYCQFAKILFNAYLRGDATAKTIVQKGFQLVYRLVEKADSVLGSRPKMILNGSLVDIYKEFLPQDRLIASPHDTEKVELLAKLAAEKAS